MKRLFLVISFLFIASNSLAQTKWFSGTFEEAKKRARQENKLILLNLTSTSS